MPTVRTKTVWLVGEDSCGEWSVALAVERPDLAQGAILTKLKREEKGYGKWRVTEVGKDSFVVSARYLDYDNDDGTPWVVTRTYDVRSIEMAIA